MPRLSVIMVRAAMLHLAVGFLIGALMLINKALPFQQPGAAGEIWQLKPVHVELLIFGWMMQLAMGVAFWILPRFPTAPKYGRVWLAMSACVLLNTGVLISSAGLLIGSPVPALIGRVVILLAVLCFVVHIAPRVRPYLIPST